MKKASFRTAAALLSAALLLTPGVSSGSTLLALDLETLSKSADHICTGTVLDAVSFRQGGRIYTLHRIAVKDAVTDNDAPGSILEVVTAGGKVGNIRQRVSGAAELHSGAEYLFFLEKRGTEGFVYPVGMVQGAYPVERDARSGKSIVRPPKGLPRLVRRESGERSRLQEAEPWIRDTESLSRLTAQIRAFRGGAR